MASSPITSWQIDGQEIFEAGTNLETKQIYTVKENISVDVTKTKLNHLNAHCINIKYSRS